MGLIDFILHIDQHLVGILNQFGGWTYLIFFLIVFIETGFVLFPFLPGDSLIFASLALAVNPKYSLNPWLCILIFVLAAVLGDTANYEIGRWSAQAGSQHNWFNRLIDKDKRLAAERFFERHGGKTIAIGRFIPLIRTFVPFVSGASNMHYGHFISYNIVGGVAWVSLFACLGVFFGNIPAVQEHFSFIVIGIVLASVVPILVVWLRKKMALRSEEQL